MNDWLQARTIVEERGVDLAVDHAQANFSRFEEAWEGLKWLLARQGHNLEVPRRNVGGKDYYLYKAASVAKGQPEIVVLYAITENEVHILGMDAYGEQETSAESAPVAKIR